MTLTFCRHVYEDVTEDICSHCGKETHRIDWKQQELLHKDWIESGKATAQGWWSI